MHVFVTGATGWVGSALVRELVAHGHRVSGLCRSENKAADLAAAGATVVAGTLDDHDRLRAAADAADAVAHLGFNHDFANFAACCEQDRRAIATLGEALHGSNRPLLVTSGLASLTVGRLSTEHDVVPDDYALPRRSEHEAARLRARGIRAGAVRLAPSTHGVGETHGFVPMLMDLARRTGVSAYVGNGDNPWSGVHRSDAARLFRLALERGVTEPTYHATAETIPFRNLAGAIGHRLGLPVESRPAEYFGWFAAFAGGPVAGNSTLTRDWLGWQPEGPGLLADVADARYYPA